MPKNIIYSVNFNYFRTYWYKICSSRVFYFRPTVPAYGLSEILHRPGVFICRPKINICSLKDSVCSPVLFLSGYIFLHGHSGIFNPGSRELLYRAVEILYSPEVRFCGPGAENSGTCKKYCRTGPNYSGSPDNSVRTPQCFCKTRNIFVKFFNFFFRPENNLFKYRLFYFSGNNIYFKNAFILNRIVNNYRRIFINNPDPNNSDRAPPDRCNPNCNLNVNPVTDFKFCLKS